MSKSLRLTGMAAALLLTALTAALLQPESARDLGLEGLAKTILEYERRSPHETADEAKRTVRAIDRRVQEKDRVAGELVDGRLTLFEAAAHFRRLNDGGPKPAAPAALVYPGDSEEECLCRQVIAYARPLLNRHPADTREADEFVARCEEELRRHKERHGAVVLPELIDSNCSVPRASGSADGPQPNGGTPLLRSAACKP
jgi:hypothetical protein